jgi:YceI-like domain
MRARSLLFAIALLFSLVVAARSDADERLIDTTRSTITVHVFKSGLFRAFADDHVIQAPLEEGVVEDSTPHVQIVIDARRMRVVDSNLSAKDREAVQARMLGPEVLDVNQFARITFHSLTIQRVSPDRWLVQGELGLHGHFNPLAVSVSLENGRYKGSATFRQSEFGITPISIAGGTVKVKDEVKIDFDIALE